MFTTKRIYKYTITFTLPYLPPTVRDQSSTLKQFCAELMKYYRDRNRNHLRDNTYLLTYRHRLLKKSEGSAVPVERTASRWIKPGEQDNYDVGADEKPPAEDGQKLGGVLGSGKMSSAPPSCYSMAAVATAAGVLATGSKQRSLRTTRSCRSTSQLSSYDLASALQNINHMLMTKSAGLHKPSRLIGPEDLSASPRKRPDKVSWSA